MDICPNKTSLSWKTLVNNVGELEAYKTWIKNNRELPDIGNVNLNELQEVITRLQAVIPVAVVINTDMDISGRVVKNGNDPEFVEINPYLLKSDTLIHEFGHIYIDLIGGIDNPQVKAGIAQLKGTKLEADLIKLYPDLYESDIVKFQKELLTTALGYEGAALFREESKKNRWNSWLSTFFARLKKLIGIQENVAKQLAKEIIFNNPQKFVGSVQEGIYEKRVNAPKDSKVYTDTEKLIATAKGSLSAYLSTFTKYGYEAKSDSNKRIIATLQELVNTLETNVAKFAMLDYVKAAKLQSEAVRKILDNAQDKDISLEKLNFVKDYGISFDPDLVRGMIKELQKYDDIPKEEYDVLKDVLYSHTEIKELYLKISRKVLASKLATQPNTASDSWFKELALREWSKQIPEGLSKEELKSKKQEFINNYLANNKEVIAKHKQEYFEDFFKTIPKDLVNFYYTLVGLKDLNSDIIKYTIQLIEQAEAKSRGEINTKVKQGTAIYDKYIKYYGKHSDPKKQYEPILVKGPKGEATPVLVGKLDPKYVGTPVEDLYNYFKKLCADRDEGLPEYSKLGLKLPRINKTTIERFISDGVVNTIKEELKDSTKARARDTDLGEQKTDDEKLKAALDNKVEILVNGAGVEKSTLPIHFRGELDEKEQSYDVMTLLLLDYSQASNFKNKLKILPIIDAIREQIKEADVIQTATTLDLVKINKNTGLPYSKKGVDSNVIKAFEAVIAQRLFGTAFDNPDMKIAKTLTKWTSFITLSLNWMSAGANFLQGSAATFIEGASQEFYGKKNVANAWVKWHSNIGANVGDIGANKYMSKINLLAEKYDALMNWQAMKDDFVRNDRFKRMIKMDLLFSLNHVAETSTQQLMMLSAMDNIKVYGADGKYLSKDGKSTENREEAMTLDEAWQVGYLHLKSNKTITEEQYKKLSAAEQEEYSEGALSLNPLAVRSEISQEPIESDDTQHTITQRLNRINLKGFGNYSASNKSIVKRTMIGALVGHMRGFLIQGFRERYKGINKLYMKDSEAKLKFRTIRREELRFEDLNYNMQTNQFEEGSYVSTLRFLSRFTSALKSSKLNLTKSKKEAWEELSDHEKANIRRTLTEAGLIILLLTTAVILSNMAEDDDDEALLYAAFFTRRLYSELFTYASISEGTRTLRSPAVSLSIVEGTIDALRQTLGPQIFDEYESGRFKGENKAYIKWMKITPFKVATRDIEASLQFLEK